MPSHVAACFDLDGTLVDTEPVHLLTEARCLDSLGVDPASRRHPRTFGMGIETGMKVLAETYRLDARQVLDTYLPLWESGLRRELRMLPSATEVLDWLAALGVPAAMVTSGDRAYVGLVDSALGVVRRFRAVVTSPGRS